MKFILYSVLYFLILISSVSAQSCITAADADCNGLVNLSEVTGYINAWYSCSACAPDLLGAINAYYNSGGPASSAFSFVYPTLPDGASITETFADLNLTIDKSDVEAIGLSWDGADFPLYDGSLVFMSNFDNEPELGENGTLVKDLGLHGNDGIVRGGPYWTPSGRYGGAFGFRTGYSGYVDLGDRDYFSFIDGGGNARPITMSVWIRMNDATNFPILGKGSGSGNEWALFTSYTNKLTFYSRDPDGDYIGRSYSKDLSPQEGQWIHVAASYNGRNLSSHFKLYYNGERVDDGWYGSHSDAVYGGPRNTAQPLAIGMNANGTIDEVRIWDRILSDEEIRMQYDSNLKKYDEGKWNLYSKRTNLSRKDYAYSAWAQDSSGSREYSERRSFSELTDVCVLTSAYWSAAAKNWEEKVTLTVNGTNCERRPVNFAIHENDGFGGSGGVVSAQPEASLITGGTSAATWRTEWKDDSGTDPEYYFVASLADNPDNSVQSGLMTVGSFCNATCLSLRVGCGKRSICGVEQDCGECLVRKTSWEPIIGIPEPPFGISETHWMYEHATYDFGEGPEPYRMGDDGPYTHYVDNQNPSATDSYNPYGTKEKPRLTIPPPPSAGSVVEIHGGPYGSMSFENSGTVEKPIFIRGVYGDEPVVTGQFNVFSSYFIIENIDFDRKGAIRKAVFIDDSRGENNSNIAIRHNEFHNTPVRNIEGVAMVRVISYSPNYSMQNITIFNNHFHHSGEGRNDSISTRDIDGVGIGQNVKNIWIVNNLMHHHGGDSIALMESSLTDNSSILASHIYVGKNVMHDDSENAVDIKRTTNVVVSQNRMYNYGPGHVPDSGGAALRYGTYDYSFPVGRSNIWTIFNEIYNVTEQQGGIIAYNAPELGEPGLGDEEYYIGNIVRDCHREARNDSSALASWSQIRVYWINNLVYNCDIGGYFWGHLNNASQNENLTVINNIFSRLHDSKSASNLIAFQILDYSGGKFLNQSEMSNNLLFDPRGGMKISYTWKQNTTSTKYNQNYYNISAWSQAYPAKSAGFMEEDPVFMSPGSNDFHLSPGSPAINAGADAKKYYDRFEQFFGISIYNDFDGNPIAGRQDIGPFECG